MRRGPWGDAAAAAGFLARLGPFLRQPVALPDAPRRLEASMRGRDAALGAMIRRAVFGHAPSPYLALLQAARLGADAVDAMIRQSGVEGALERLHDAGVFVTLEEFKGLRPIRRAGLELPIRPEDFDNPLGARDYEARTGGSGGSPRRIVVGLDLLAHEADYHACFYEAHQAWQRPASLWLPAPPGAVGIKNALIRGRLGVPVVHWFSQNRAGTGGARHRAFSAATRLVARASGRRVPPPDFTPAAAAGRVASWLAEQRAHGGPLLLTTPSGAVRACAAAAEQRLDIAGSLFVMVGEPYTEAKDRVISGAGCSGATHYAMVESGLIGLACRRPVAPDDVHLVSDKVATILRPRSSTGNGAPGNALFHTTLLRAAPKVMLNVESGDSGVLQDRDCECGVLPPVFRRHLHTIRSYEKLTSEGMHVLGVDLIALVEDVLVARFGGRPTDWQLVEREEGGVARVSLVASPAIGDLHEEEVRRTVLDFLRRRGAGPRLMAEVWENAATLRLVRADPHVTPAGKIQPLQRF